jgi:hypothetical protein
MGESPKAEIPVYSSTLESFSIETPGGRIHIHWDNNTLESMCKMAGPLRTKPEWLLNTTPFAPPCIGRPIHPKGAIASTEHSNHQAQ